MPPIPPLYFCPDCEGHNVFMYAGKVIAKRCSRCSDLRTTALTGADRGIDEVQTQAIWKRAAFGGPIVSDDLTPDTCLRT